MLMKSTEQIVGAYGYPALGISVYGTLALIPCRVACGVCRAGHLWYTAVMVGW